MGKKKSSIFSARNIAFLAVLVALVVVLQVFGSSLTIAGLSLNLALVPIALGAIVFGPLFGGLLGFICGFIILINGIIGNEPFTFYLFSQNPVAIVVVCLLKTTLAGVVAGFAYKLIAKKNKLVGVFVASALVPIVNTGVFAIACFMILDGIVSYLGVVGLDVTGMSATYIVFGIVITWNFFIELLTSLILAPAVSIVTNVVEKQITARIKTRKTAEQAD
jgi:uncharacterized membrane protein